MNIMIWHNIDKVSTTELRLWFNILTRELITT